MKIIVFGGSGFLGSHVCDKLSEAGHEVTIFDRVSSPYLRPEQRMIVGNILNEIDVENAIKGNDVVFNFAGIADIDEAKNKPSDTIKYNVLGNGYILDSCIKSNVKRYIFASSAYVFSKAGSFYRASKQACELFIEAFHETYQLEYTILRYGSLYGSRADERNAIYRFIKEAFTKGTITYSGGPDSIREYIHVEDAARSSVEILKNEYANQHIVLTGHQPMKVSDLFLMIGEMLPFPVNIQYVSKDSAHYTITPYSFNPRTGKKYAPPYHVDMGQGLLQLMETIHKELNMDIHEELGYLVKD